MNEPARARDAIAVFLVLAAAVTLIVVMLL